MLMASCSGDEILLRPFTDKPIEGASSSYAMLDNGLATECLCYVICELKESLLWMTNIPMPLATYAKSLVNTIIITILSIALNAMNGWINHAVIHIPIAGLIATQDQLDLLTPSIRYQFLHLLISILLTIRWEVPLACIWWHIASTWLVIRRFSVRINLLLDRWFNWSGSR